MLRKPNEYVFYDTFIEVICLNKLKAESGRLIIDLDDYDKCKEYKWCISQNRGVSRSKDGVLILISRLIMDCLEFKKNEFVDHKNRNPYDNRKENLRIIDNQKNSFNTSLGKNNTSGIMGVRFDKHRNTWNAELMLDGKWKVKKRYKIKEEAVKKRLESELIYFGKEFAPQRHLFEEYGILEELTI